MSSTALHRASGRATTAGVEARIDFQQHDLAHSFPCGVFDLVTALYLLSPVEFPRDRILQAAAGSVAPSGLLLIVDHASTAPWSWNQATSTRFPTPEEALAALDLEPGRWSTERVGATERQAIGPNGQIASVTDTVIALRYRAP